MEVIEALPVFEFCNQIDVSFIAWQLVKLLLVRAVRPFHLSVQLRFAAFDIGMSDGPGVDAASLCGRTAECWFRLTNHIHAPLCPTAPSDNIVRFMIAFFMTFSVSFVISGA